MKRIRSKILAAVACLLAVTSAFSLFGTKTKAETQISTGEVSLGINAKGVYLMEASSGAVLYSEDSTRQGSPASVTKIMTLLLVCEALEAGSFSTEDKVTVSAYAASMGGSQVFLEEGERLSVEELIKCTVIASANDAAVALAELTAGSESAFVARMNKRAKELGLGNTSFENVTGLDDTTVNHYSCPRDIALMSRELLKYDIILKYSGTWQDTIRGGEFTLTNTNRLVRYYEGCNGLKTGSTDKAGFCVSTTAKRGDMQLIAVVMGAPTKEDRNEAARALLDYGFSTYGVYKTGEEYLEVCPVNHGVADGVPLYSKGVSFVTERALLSEIEREYSIPESLSSPIQKGEAVGKVIYRIGDRVLCEAEIYAGESVEVISFFEILLRIIKKVVIG